MPYLYCEFNIEPPIREAIEKTPEDIKLINENDTVTKFRS
jgi:hypothetical protein